jgi:hypothetical protein
MFRYSFLIHQIPAVFMSPCTGPDSIYNQSSTSRSRVSNNPFRETNEMFPVQGGIRTGIRV